jgi:DNA-binding IclR family transcriptional regulator
MAKPVDRSPSPENPIALTEFLPDAPYGRATGAVHRALEILELFSVVQTPLSVGEVAAKLGYPQSSTSVLLRGLAELGYLEHDRRARTFQPTLRVAFLGMWIHHRVLSEGSLLEFMETLAAKSGQVALLGMQNGIYAQYIHIVAARASRVGLKPGLLRSICRSAVGKILLSSKRDDEVRRIVRHTNAVEKQFAAPVDIDALLAELAEVRRTGFAYSVDTVTKGSSVIATRLLVDFGGAPLGVGIAVHTDEIDRLRPVVVELLRDAVKKFFPAEPREMAARRQRVLPPQSGYAVNKRT